MQGIIDFVSQPWHWSISGTLIVLVMMLLLWFGGEFGVSSNFRTICSMAGAGKKVDFFRFDWKAQIWNLVFVIGAIAGGYLAITYLPSKDPVQISQSTQEHLSSMGISTPQELNEGAGYLPKEIYDVASMDTKMWAFLIIGGLLIGFGTRYAGGCTSGHAISGLSNLQLPSLIAVIGFFAGGLLMTWLILPQIL